MHKKGRKGERARTRQRASASTVSPSRPPTRTARRQADTIMNAVSCNGKHADCPNHALSAPHTTHTHTRREQPEQHQRMHGRCHARSLRTEEAPPSRLNSGVPKSGSYLGSRATCDVRRATCDVRHATCNVRRARSVGSALSTTQMPAAAPCSRPPSYPFPSGETPHEG